MTQKIPYRSLHLKRDHARPRQQPAVSDAAVEARLSELVSSATYALTHEYHRLGLRTRILNLPIMVAFVLALIWRQIPSVGELLRMLAREPLLGVPPVHVSQQAISLRLRTLPANLFGDVFAAIVARRPIPSPIWRLKPIWASSNARANPKPARNQTLTNSSGA